MGPVRAVTFIVAMLVTLAGCSGYETASLVFLPDGMCQTQPAEFDRSDAASRRSLGLLRSALGLAAASGRQVPEAEAEDASTPEGACCIVRLDRGESGGEELWLLRRRYTIRQLEGGARVTWKGDFSHVLESLALLSPANGHWTPGLGHIGSRGGPCVYSSQAVPVSSDPIWQGLPRAAMK